ncbi:hypothetical protein [Haloarcula salina]|uniref:Uncharacterized protein n=1 Tax=Haloarcula salina TaxID=1429914 RepID=A0AA41FZ35_9EURY|nr:hypothetical protein [Haloarcula salina]MBV0900303.1 hypothetical protein [Haloarcula salina]
MNEKLLAVSGVCALVFAGGVLAFVAGVGPLPDGGDPVSPLPTETPTAEPDTAAGDERTGGGAQQPSATERGTERVPPFVFAIDAIESCGRTCRDVTSTLTNRQDRTATNVTVSTRIYAGNDTGGEPVWSGTEPVGTLDGGDAYTATRRVELSYRDGFAIQRAGGWITVQTTVTTADRTVTLTDRRNVG